MSRRKVTAFVHLSLLGVVSSLATIAMGQGKVSRPEPDVLGLAREAFIDSKTMLKSGMGKGTIEWHWDRGALDTKTLTGKFSSYFKGNKFYVRLRFDDPAESPYVWTIIIADGTGRHFSSKFWNRPQGWKEHQVEGYVHEPEGYMPFQVGFPWSMSEPWVTNFVQLFKNGPANAFKVKELAGKGYQIRYEVGTKGSFTTIDLFEKDGWNAAKRVSYRDAETPPFQIFENTWARTKGVWHVDSMMYQIEPFERRNRLDGLQRWNLKYQSFEPNCDVSDDRFSLDALDLEPGCRITERIPNQGVCQYSYEKDRTTPKKKTDGILEQIRRLPELGTVEPPPRPF